MTVIPFIVSKTQYSIYVILGTDNLERIRQYDPAEITLDKMGEIYSGLQLKDVIIGYATDDEVQQVIDMCNAGRIHEALRMISRGFRFRPDRGDYDGPYLSGKTSRDEPKQ